MKNSLALICRVGFALLPGCGALLGAEPAESPLAGTPDPLGAALQRTFISAPESVADQTPGTFIAYRKTFQLVAAPREAQIHIFADARYLAWLNGKPILRGPDRFDTRGPEYDTLEVGGALHAGANTLAIVVMGYAGGAGPGGGGIGQGHNSKMMKHATGLTVRLDAGGQPLVETDGSWKWNDQTRYRPAKIDWANIVDRIDSRVEEGDWTQPDYDDRAWGSAVSIDGGAWGPLSARRIPLLRDTPVAARIEGGAVLPVTLEAGQQLRFSMGRLVQAYTEMELDAAAGTEFTLNYAGIDYTARAGRQTYISSDTAAFDDGVITVKSGRVTILGLKFSERLYPFDLAGSFQSSDPLLDRLWSVCTRTLQILSEDAYVDCADRERAEWMDCDPPDFDVTRTAMAGPGSDGKPLYADARLLGEMLRRTALTEQKEGWVKAHTCSDRFDIHARMEDRACDWVEGARRYYESTGDTTLIREIWPVIVAQMDYFLAHRTERGLVLAREWVVWGNPVGYVTCEGAGLNAFVYKALVDAAYLGRVIGDAPNASRLEEEAGKLAAAFNTVLWDEQDGTYYSGYYSEDERAKADGRARQMKLGVKDDLIEPTMFSGLWALDQEIVPAARRARVLGYVLKNRGEAQRTMTFYYLFKQMYAAGDDALEREVLDTIRAKWKPQAESVWGTCWEDLDGGSKAHCYGMFPAYFLSAYVLGVRPVLPVSSRQIVIEPRLGDLSFAQGTVVTEFGPVPVAWKIGKNGLQFRVTVPEGVTATMVLPGNGPSSRLVFAGERLPTRAEGRYLVAQIGPGVHEGSVETPNRSE